MNLSQMIIEIFSNMIKNFMSFFANLIQASIVVLIGWLVAKLVATIVQKVLQNVGIDKIGEKLNEIDTVKGLKLEIKLSTVISKILYYFILIFILQPAADTLGVPAISDMIKLIVTFIPKMISAVLMLSAGVFLADALKNFVITLCKSFNIAAGKLIGTAVFFFLFIIFLIQSVAQIGINTSLFESTFNLIIGGIIFAFAIGYGFASKEILLNIISSFYSKNRYKGGEIIEIDGIKGEIIAIDNTTITLKTGDSKTIFPLQVLQSKTVTVFN